MTETVSPALARRIALAAQGFGRKRPARVGAADLGRLVARLALHQIDSVNVLVRAHYLPAFSRLGAYDRGLIDRAAWGRRSERRLFEYWAHEASLLPLDLHPMMRWRMARAERGEIRGFGRGRADAAAVLARIRDEGAMAASDFENGRSASGWWEWSEAKHALEYLFWTGHVTTATRRGSFERVYDLPERVIPAGILALPTPDAAEAQRRLIDRAGRALGIATAAELRDYFRLKPAEADPAIAALAEEGVLERASIAGQRAPVFIHRDARRPRRIEGQALLAPFDPLVWERARTERLFGFRYRIGIYTPAAKREHGYYVLPFLMDEQLVARVDLKANRARGRLLVRQTTIESDAPAETRGRLRDEIALMARWLGFDGVEGAGAIRSA